MKTNTNQNVTRHPAATASAAAAGAEETLQPVHSPPIQVLRVSLAPVCPPATERRLPHASRPNHRLSRPRPAPRREHLGPTIAIAAGTGDTADGWRTQEEAVSTQRKEGLKTANIQRVCSRVSWRLAAAANVSGHQDKKKRELSPVLRIDDGVEPKDESTPSGPLNDKPASTRLPTFPRGFGDHTPN